MENILLCEIHNSPIGGVCSFKNCENNPSLMCIKCIVDPNNCIRKFNHNIISLKEFFENDIDFKNIEKIRELYKNFRFLEINETKDKFAKIYNNQSSKNTCFRKMFEDKIDMIYSKENKEIIKNKDEMLITLRNSINVLKYLQNEFTSYLFNNNEYFDENFNFKIFINNLINNYNSTIISNNEIYSKLENYILNLKKLIINYDDDKINESLNTVNSYVDYISKPFKLNCDIAVYNSIIKELKAYFSSPKNENTITESKKISKPIKYNSVEKIKHKEIFNFFDKDMLFISEKNLLILHNSNFIYFYEINNKKFEKIAISDSIIKKKNLELNSKYYIACLDSNGIITLIDIDSKETQKIISNIENNKDKTLFDIFSYNNSLHVCFSDNKAYLSNQKSIKVYEYEALNVNFIEFKNIRDGLIFRGSENGLEILNLYDFKLYHKFSFKRKCIDFCISIINNVEVIYALWDNGIVIAYSLIKKTVLREFDFNNNLKKQATYCISNIKLNNTNNLIVGSNQNMILITIKPSSFNTKKLKEDGKIIKIFQDNSNNRIISLSENILNIWINE